MTTHPMNPDVKALWLERLRGNDYRQGQSALARKVAEYPDGLDDPPRVVTKHCCLGVLCEMAVEQGIVERLVLAERFGYVVDTDRVGRYPATTEPPRAVLEWAGLSVHDGLVTLDVDMVPGYDSEGDPITLAALNDSGSFPFARIADLIEENL